jgi:hypothetical protein
VQHQKYAEHVVERNATLFHLARCRAGEAGHVPSEQVQAYRNLSCLVSVPWRRRLHRCSCAVSVSILFVLTGFLWARRQTRVWLLLSGFSAQVRTVSGKSPLGESTMQGQNLESESRIPCFGNPGIHSAPPSGTLHRELECTLCTSHPQRNKAPCLRLAVATPAARGVRGWRGATGEARALAASALLLHSPIMQQPL